jgi:23S rRNA pseudouridine1911/1915/1917 synthase
VKTVSRNAPGAKRAELRYEVVDTAADGRTWLAVRPLTGRSHQIRVQLAALGCPIAGDLRYGSGPGFGRWIALHARRLTFAHPTLKEPVTIDADWPAEFRKLDPPRI